MSDGKNQLYRTSDLYFSAYLCAIDVPLETTEEDNTGHHKRVVFVFSVPTEVIRRAKAQFFGGTGTVRALKFSNSLQMLKKLCFV